MNENHLKMVKMLFISSEKLSLLSGFLYWFFGHVKKTGLIRMIRLISKFMRSQLRLQTVALHILCNISGSNRNQTIKFAQILEYNKIIIFQQIILHKIMQGDYFQTFCFLKKLYVRWTQVVFSLFSICFDGLQLGIT